MFACDAWIVSEKAHFVDICTQFINFLNGSFEKKESYSHVLIARSSLFFSEQNVRKLEEREYSIWKALEEDIGVIWRYGTLRHVQFFD